MAKSVIGVQWAMSAKDEGLEAEQKKAASGFELLGNVIKATSNAILGMTTAQTNLTTQREADLFHINRTARQALFNLGKTDAALVKDATRLADVWGLSGDEAANAVLGYQKAGDVIKTAGFDVDSFAQMAKMSGVNANDLGEQLAGLTKIFHGDAQAAGKAFQQYYEGADSVGNIQESMANFGGFVDKLREKSLNVAGSDMSSLQEFASGYAKLGGVVKNATKITAKDAIALTDSLSSSQLNAQATFEGMFGGLEGSTEGFVQNMAIIKGTVGAATDDMSKDPLKFVASLATMGKELHKTQQDTDLNLNMIHRRLTDTFGKETGDKLFNVFQTSAQDASGATAQSFEDAVKTMGKVSHVQEKTIIQHGKKIKKVVSTLGKEQKKAFGTPRTAQEEADRMYAIEETRRRKFGDSNAKILKQVADGIKMAGDEFDKMDPTMKNLYGTSEKLGIELALMPPNLREIAFGARTLQPFLEMNAKGFSDIWGILSSLGSLFVGVTGISKLFGGFSAILGTLGSVAGSLLSGAAIGGLIVAVSDFIYLLMSGKSPLDAFTESASDMGNAILHPIDKLKEIGSWIKSIFGGAEEATTANLASLSPEALARIKKQQQQAGTSMYANEADLDKALQQRQAAAQAQAQRLLGGMPGMAMGGMPAGVPAGAVQAQPVAGAPPGGGTMAVLDRSVHDPEWYSGDFKTLFTQKMDALIQAMNGYQPPGARAAAAGRGAARGAARTEGPSVNGNPAATGSTVGPSGVPAGRH